MRIRVKHQTRYSYDEAVKLGPHVVRLRPAEHTRARVLSYNLEVTPAAEVRWQHDPWGNRLARLTFPVTVESDRLELEVDLALDVRPVNPFDFFVDDRCRQLPFRYPDGLEQELAPFLGTSIAGPRLSAFLESLPFRGYVVDWLVALNQKVAGEVLYIIRNEPGIQSSEETLALARGSCRDSARLLVDAIRARGLAARFASGYLVQLADEGAIPDMARGVDHDVVDLHAWAEVFLPGAGWIGLDGTSGLLTGEGHIPLACTVQPDLASPVEGTASRGAADFEFRMQVVRLGHEPRPRKPYTDSQWAAIRSAGEQLDRRVAELGMHLTMGGEPTWTSREFPAAPEWNHEALGPTKWAAALAMADELTVRLGNGPLVLHRQGKHYPGESLPRWAVDLHWRTDGVPIWRDPALRALEPSKPSDTRADLAIAERLAAALARRLGVPQNWIPGYEDPWRFLMDEQNLPLDVDPLKAKLDDPEDRRRLARVLGRGLGTVVGYALPLGKTESGWTTSPWQLRRGQLFLLPGDGPMGLRLPLASLGGKPFELYVRDPSTLDDVGQPFEQARRRETATATSAWGYQGRGAPIEQRPGNVAGIVRTALCIEPREGTLHVFLPPVGTADDFLELVESVEDAAAEVSHAVRVEGYRPPPDPRLRHCALTPDPGVLEVNVPVTERFSDYVALLETLSDAANHAGLCTEKYQLDGREVGSGGGNHITLGGPTTQDSPFLQRPALLASFLRFIQNHPSLSYLFTGLFVGPTSQAPRVDEARHDSLYELEIALHRLESARDPVPPWFVDRALRNLLVDVAGSTHRTEVCIDKLYDPHNPLGRLGLLELRAFEMPPHERMAVAQMLLVRSLVASLASQPYRRPLVPWGSELHDRFMLPHYLWRDFLDVVEHVSETGLSLDASWYVPFLDHRLPVFGTHQMEDVTIEIRAAIEPWPVLGEEPTGATVSRYVDSSVERLQVRVDGITEGRHVVMANGRALPLRPTGRAAERVCGVRYRAWQPPHCLQPHIPIQHPLRFDVVDTWARRSLGACTYHVWHPEGRAYEDPPLTAFDAAARRAQRFTTLGHTPYPVSPIVTPSHPDQPFTLDLRT
ncbi:MAG: transglutaminase family protein [Deltaproteobacteria bacterium]|nr:transglutaminase family protein [Deltaproteobacteria bacterium]